MQRIRIAFGADRIQKLHQGISSLANEALRRKGWDVFWFDFTKVRKNEGQIYLPLRQLQGRVTLTKGRMLSKGPVIEVPAEFLDAIILKKDPPLQEQSLKLLKEASRRVLVISNPQGIAKYAGKGMLRAFKAFTAPTVYSKKAAVLQEAIRRMENCVLKPERGFGSNGIYHIFLQKGSYYSENKDGSNSKKINLPDLLKRLTGNGTREVLVVKYLKRVAKGDKRIFVFNGKVLGAVLRIPPKGSWICNMSAGGSAKPTRLTESEKKIVKQVGDTVSKDGIVFIGIDTLENDQGKRILSEVNTTNVGGIATIERLYHRDVSKHILDWVERKVRQGSTKQR